MSEARKATLGAVLAESADAYKGLLMLVVVLDHNEYAHILFPSFFRILTFHVLGFLLLPFALGHPALTRRFIVDRVVRYGVPQFWTLTLAAILFWVLEYRTVRPSEALANYIAAIVVGSGPLVKASSGFLAYWFLPTLIGLVVVLAAFRSANLYWRRTMVATFVIAHCVAVAAWWPWWYGVPLGLPIIVNIFVLGLAFAWLVASPEVYRLRWTIAPIFLMSYGWLMATGAWLKLPELQMAAITQPATFIAQDLAALAGTLTVLLLASRLRGSTPLTSIGRHSLVIYLAHPFVYVALEMVRVQIGWQPALSAGQGVVGLVEFAVALGVAWMAAVVIARTPLLATWLTPRDCAGWPPVSALKLAVTR